MSDLLSTIARELGPSTLAQLGQSVGASPAQTQSAVSAALPALLAGLARNASTPAGAQSLATALDRDHGPSLMDSFGPLAGAMLGGGGGAGMLGGLMGALGGGGASAAPAQPNLGSLLGALAGGGAPAQPPRALDGAGILGHVLGGQQGAVVQSVARASGLDPAVVARLLPVLAPVVMSALGTMKSQQGLDAGGVASLVQGEHRQLSGGAAHAQGPAGLDLASIGSALAQSGLLGRLFG